MSPLAKEFVRLKELMGWNQSETARQLYITPSYVNQICNGNAEPSEALIRLFKLTAVSQRPDLEFDVGIRFAGGGKVTEPGVLREKPRAEWVKDIEGELSELSDADRVRVIESLKQIVRMIPRKPVSYLKKRKAAS